MFVLTCLVGQASATLLTEYDISNNADSSIAASNEADHVSGSSLAATGVSVLTGYGRGIFVAKAWSETLERNTSQYYEWAITADNGYAIAFDSIDLAFTRGHYQSEHGAESWQLYASIDGFATSDILLQTWDISSSDYDTINLFTGQDISALGTLPGTVTFRLYGFDADHDGQSGDYSGLAYAHDDLTGVGTNLSIHGTTVPEPPVTLFLCAGASILASRRKKIGMNSSRLASWPTKLCAINRIPFYIAILAVIFAPTGKTKANTLYHRDLPDNLLTDVAEHFPGNGHLEEMDGSMLTADANLHLTCDSTVSLTFLDEAAGYHNSLGYFVFDSLGNVLEQSIVFEDYSEIGGGGTLTPGDTIDLGIFDAGINLGFYIVPKGKKSPHYTLDALNPYQSNYTAFYTHEASGYGILGFEDLKKKPAGKTAYNDAIVGITASPTPEPATASLFLLGGLAMIRRKK